MERQVGQDEKKMRGRDPVIGGGQLRGCGRNNPVASGGQFRGCGGNEQRRGGGGAGVVWETQLDGVGVRGGRYLGRREGGRHGPDFSESEQKDEGKKEEVWMMTGRRRRRLQSMELTFPGGAELTCDVKLDTPIAEDGDVSVVV